MSTHQLRRLWSATVTVGCCLALVTGQPASAPASIVDSDTVAGLIRVEATNSDQGLLKTAFANCPANTFAIGGGGRVNDSGAGQVMLTALVPKIFHFEASAAAPPGFPYNYTLTAYAICGPPPAGMQLVHQQGAVSSSTFKQTTAACPPGKRVLSVGAVVNGGSDSLFGPGFVGLHLVRPNGPLTFGRAVAREIGAGYSGFWSVHAIVVCAFPIPGQQNIANVVNGSLAFAFCPAGTQIHGAGGGGAIFDVGPQFLQSVTPGTNLTAAGVAMTSAPPPGIGMVAQATCAR